MPRLKKNSAELNELEYQKTFQKPKTLEILDTTRINVKCKNEAQKQLLKSIKDNDITICTGAPGTGKTFLSCYQSIMELKNNNLINKIVIIKSVTTLKSEELGFLKGTLSEKMEPFIYSFIKNFEKIIGPALTEKMQHEKLIETLPIAYMRGINIDNAIVIIDEVQNITIENIRTILTRLGENSKMILLGDTNQIDIKNKKDSSLSFLMEKFQNIERIGTVKFNPEDVIRHPLIVKIEEVFNRELNPPKENVVVSNKKETKQLLTEEKTEPGFLKKLFK
jgi:phosphate starvation-inducible protein PhoH and related proteins